MEELREACRSQGIPIDVAEKGGEQALTVSVDCGPNHDPEAFHLRTESGRPRIRGASEVGCARGLIYLADRIRIEGRLPKLEIDLQPAFPLRFMHVGVGSLDLAQEPYFDESRYASVLDATGEEIKQAFLRGANRAIFHSTYRISTWTDPPDSERTKIYRRLYADAARLAHSYGMKALVIGDEFLYQDGIMERAGAQLSPEDDGFWKLLQDRYREILREVPELDGIASRIGEMLPIGHIRAFDIIHNDSRLSVQEKFRRFVEAMYQVVVREFGKLYYQRTWVVNDWEQHSVECIFRDIFRDIPRENMIISIKLTKCDQWWYQAFNPTFGQTDHDTVVELEMHHGPHGSMEYPDYMGEWFQAGLNYVLGRGARGVFTGRPQTLWMDAHHYAVERLAWDPSLDPGLLAEEWAAKVFGRKTRKAIGRLLLLSDDAMRKALYIRPYASTHAWNPLEHLITGVFVLAGDPLLDGGREHARFLREFYLLSKPTLDETIGELHQGLEIYDEMLSLFRKARPSIEDRELARKAAKSLKDGKVFLSLNVTYVEAFMRFFAYEELKDSRSRRIAERAVGRLRRALERYSDEVGWFQTPGIDAFLDLADSAFDDLDAYLRALGSAPGLLETRKMLEDARKRDIDLCRRSDAMKVLHLEVDVDGADLIRIRGRELEIQHISCESYKDLRYEFEADLPRAGSLAIRPLEVRGWAYVAEQPTARNDYTAKIMISDPQNGRSVYRLEVWWVPEGGSD